jgi:hypothetical protein
VLTLKKKERCPMRIEIRELDRRSPLVARIGFQVQGRPARTTFWHLCYLNGSCEQKKFMVPIEARLKNVIELPVDKPYLVWVKIYSVNRCLANSNRLEIMMPEIEEVPGVLFTMKVRFIIRFRQFVEFIRKNS